MPFKVLHHFHDAYVTSISHVKKKICSSITLRSSQVQFQVLHHFHDVYVIYLPCFNKTFIHHTYNRKCHSKDYITFYDVDVHLSFMFKKINCSFIILQSAFKRVYITLKMWMWSIIHVFKKKFIHHLTKCHSKVLHHFQNADVIYYPCF